MWGLIVELLELERPEPSDGLAVVPVDDRWTLAVNRGDSGMPWRGLIVGPHQVGVSWNGWPVGLCSPDGAYVEETPGGDREDLTAALQRRIDELREQRRGAVA